MMGSPRTNLSSLWVGVDHPWGESLWEWEAGVCACGMEVLAWQETPFELVLSDPRVLVSSRWR